MTVHALETKLRRMFPRAQVKVKTMPPNMLGVAWGGYGVYCGFPAEEAEQRAARMIMASQYGTEVSGGRSRRGREVTILAVPKKAERLPLPRLREP